MRVSQIFLRNVAAGARSYFADAWNKFDFAIVLLSYVGMVVDLLEAVAYLHDQGLPHLCLSGRTVYVAPGDAASPPAPPRIKVVGIGAGPQLIAASRQP